MCVLTSFWVLRAPKSWLNYFFCGFQPFLLISNLFQYKAVFQLTYTYNTHSRQWVHCLYIFTYKQYHAQAGIDPLAQSHASSEASALSPSHHGWIKASIMRSQLKVVNPTIHFFLTYLVVRFLTKICDFSNLVSHYLTFH